MHTIVACCERIVKTSLVHKTCLYILGHIAYIFNRRFDASNQSLQNHKNDSEVSVTDFFQIAKHDNIKLIYCALRIFLHMAFLVGEGLEQVKELLKRLCNICYQHLSLPHSDSLFQGNFA